MVSGTRIETTAYGAAALEQLRDVVARLKSDDPMKPVTLLLPNNLAGVAARRFLASTSIAALYLATLPRLAEQLAAGLLAAYFDTSIPPCADPSMSIPDTSFVAPGDTSTSPFPARIFNVICVPTAGALTVTVSGLTAAFMAASIAVNVPAADRSAMAAVPRSTVTGAFPFTLIENCLPGLTALSMLLGMGPESENPFAPGAAALSVALINLDSWLI